nr:MAG TPA: hypothetical protein [Caudoviricetes sp.]
MIVAKAKQIPENRATTGSAIKKYTIEKPNSPPPANIASPKTNTTQNITMFTQPNARSVRIPLPR